MFVRQLGGQLECARCIILVHDDFHELYFPGAAELGIIQKFFQSGFVADSI
jgi:hypothetical protein